MNNTKKSLLTSITALVVCFTMLVSSTFAWFTSTVSSANNIIASGNLKVELLHDNAYTKSQAMTPVEVTEDVDKTQPQNKLFVDAAGNDMLWEPGAVAWENFTIRNAGDLALVYQFALSTDKENYVVNADGTATNYGLSQVLKVGVVDGGLQDVSSREAVINAVNGSWSSIKNFVKTDTNAVLPNDDATTEANETERVVGVVVYWQPSDSDNLYNLNNGKTVSNAADGATALAIDLGIKVIATQASYEEDSFGSDYDAAAADSVFPAQLINEEVTVPVSVADDGTLAAPVTLSGKQVTATVPAGTKLAPGTTALTMRAIDLNSTNGDIYLDENQESRSLDVHIDGIAPDNTVAAIFDMGQVMPTGLNLGNATLYHVENNTPAAMTQCTAAAEVDAHNEFYYNPADGHLTIALATFSEVALVADTDKAWEGKFDYSWYTNAVAPVDGEAVTEYKIANADQLAAFGAIVGGMNGQTQDSFAGKTVKLLADINLGDKESENNPNIIFYPIGYYNSEGTYERTNTAITSGLRNFEGTFDGNGHTIANFYHNTWEMKGDHDWYSPEEQYYRDGMGLFGRVYGGTVKNLTVDNFKSDGEIATTGVIAAYADGATFENIAITNCNPRVYNIGNGGIVGCVGWYAKEAGLKTTFKNITVDNSNKISALWGSYDVACGGLVGQYYPTSGQSSAGTLKNAGVHFENCHVSAQMDVYNDVCANYQYYAYRYTGMLIGSVRENVTIDGHSYPKMDGITAEGCTVHFGTWNDYYYCELVDNTTASYTHDYQMSRLVEIKAIDGTTVTYLDGTTGTVPASGRANYVIVDYTKGHGTENATCYHFKDGAVWTHDMGGIQTGIDENGDGQDDLKEDKQHIYLEFNNLVTGYGWGVTSKGVGDLAGVTILDREVADSVEKFERKFTNTNFTYRVGNKNTVALGSLFGAKADTTINGSGVVVSVDKVNENSNVSGTFTANASDWTKGTIQFSGTGVVKVTIQDYNYCTPTELYLEVVDAVNATTATSATGNNVVLLNDCGFSSLEVSDGYTLYGNGFTMTCASDSASLSFGEFVKLDSGTLDNVQIVCPNYDYAALYNSQLTGTENRSQTTDKTRYYNAKSAVVATGNSQILNSRVSGGRAAVYASNGNIVVDNSRLEGGAVATVIISAANSFVFRDATLVQKPTASTYNPNKTLMGMSVLYLCDNDGNATPTTLEDAFVQYAWVDGSCTAYMPEGTSSIAEAVLKKNDYTHTINGKTCVNLGFAYMPYEGTKVSEPNNLDDKRINKGSVPYEYESVEATVPQNGINVTIDTYVYSYQKSNSTNEAFKSVADYVPNKYSDIIVVSYADTSDALTIGKSYGAAGWIYELNVDLDKANSYALDFNKLSMSVNGVTVTDFKVNGEDKPSEPVAVTVGAREYTLTSTVDKKVYKALYKVTGIQTSKNAPQLVDADGNQITEDNVPWGEGKCVTRKADDGATNYTGAAPVLDGIIIRYWSVAENKYIDLKLSSLTPTKSTKLNGTNNFWEYGAPNGDYTLKITNTEYVHSSNKIYAMPVSDGITMYFVASASNGLVSTGSGARKIAIKYEFKDNNGGELTFDHTWNVGYNSSNSLKYSDLTGIKDGCITPDTLITLADGTQKRVDALTGDELLLVWNLETGKYEVAPMVFVDSEEESAYNVIHLNFSDDSEVKVIYEHGFFDIDLGEYVYITEANYADYIGHRFVTQGNIDKDTWNVVTLTDAFVETEVTTAWSPVTAEHLCYYTNGVLSMPGGIAGLFNIFAVDTNTMMYDATLMAQDIATYGLFSYEDFGGMITEDAYAAFNGDWLKVAIGKGMLTWDDIAYMAERYIPLM